MVLDEYDDFEESENFIKVEKKKLVDKYVKLKSTISILEEELEEIKEKLIEYALLKNKNELYGNEFKLYLEIIETYSLPEKEKSEKISQILKKNNLWEEFSQINKAKLINAIKEKTITIECLSSLRDEIEPKTIYKLYVEK